MDLVTVACNECGAPISVPRTTNFLTCGHCGVSLSVKHTNDASYTEVIQEISDRTARIEEDVAYLRRQDRLEQIDREWEREREKYMVTGQHGHRHVPTSAGAVGGVFIAIAFGITGYFFTSAAGAPEFRC